MIVKKVVNFSTISIPWLLLGIGLKFDSNAGEQTMTSSLQTNGINLESQLSSCQLRNLASCRKRESRDINLLSTQKQIVGHADGVVEDR